MCCVLLRFAASKPFPHAILAAAWSGELVRHRGEHYIVDGMRFLPPADPAQLAEIVADLTALRRAAERDPLRSPTRSSSPPGGSSSSPGMRYRSIRCAL
jgi:hypothetical protein